MRTTDDTSTHSGKRSQKREQKIGGKRISDATPTKFAAVVDLAAVV